MHIKDVYPPIPPEYQPGTPENAAREAARDKDFQERKAREEQARLDKIAAAEQKAAEALARIEQRKEAFKAREASFGGGLEAVYTAQAQLLHGVFAHAVDEYIGKGTEDDKAKIYSGIALRAQNYCRMTLSALTRLKQFHIASTTIAGKNAKTEERTISEARNGEAEMDTTAAGAAGGIDPQLAAVEEGGSKNPEGQSHQQ